MPGALELEQRQQLPTRVAEDGRRVGPIEHGDLDHGGEVPVLDVPGQQVRRHLESALVCEREDLTFGQDGFLDVESRILKCRTDRARSCPSGLC